jgi:hypothetical protein
LSAREPTNTELLTAINALRSELHGEMAALESGLHAEITQLGTGLREEIVKSRGETARLFENVQTSLDGIREDLTVVGAANDRTRQAGQNTRDEGRAIADSLANIERILLKHGTRLDELEKRASKP